MVEITSDTESYIRGKAVLYGAQNPSLALTTHQKKMNEASQGLALANPSLLNDRRKLIELARSKVDDDGYTYKHGKSRSKHLRSESGTSTSSGPRVKRTKTNETERLQRIAYVEESIRDIQKQIGFKEKRREQLSNVHNYRQCDKVSDEICTLKPSQARQTQSRARQTQT